MAKSLGPSLYILHLQVLVQEGFVRRSNFYPTPGRGFRHSGLLRPNGQGWSGYDALQRLNHAVIKGLSGSTQTQDFDYDRWGNRIKSLSCNSAGDVLPEVRSWEASYDATNSLPKQVTRLDANGKATAYTDVTGVVYDNSGRITDVLAVPGDQTTYTHWGYDPMGRVVQENGSTFLLDAEGLRFKRMKADGSITYTVYGFDREPLTVFEKAAPSAPAPKSVSANLQTSSSLKTAKNSASSTLSGMIIIPPEDPDYYSIICSPFKKTVWVGTNIDFVARGKVGANPRYYWNFGDGTNATPAGTYSHRFNKAGTYTVSVGVTSREWSGESTSTITVIERPVISRIEASHNPIYRGSSSNYPLPTKATLSWTVLNADVLSMDNGIGVVTGSTSCIVSPTQNTTYTLTATNAGGSITAPVTVSVDSLPPPAIVSLNQSAMVVNPGEGVTFTWSASHYDAFSMLDVLAPGSTATSVTVYPLQNTTYTLKAINSAGTVSRDLTVVVCQKPMIEAFMGTPARIALGQSAKLTWGVANFTTLSINGIAVAGNTQGFIEVTPTTTTEYILTASNALGSVMARTTVIVGEANTGALAWKKSMVYGFGQLISEETPDGVRYIQSDQVGTPNTIINSDGVEIGRSKNLPFGERFSQTGEKSFRRYTNHEYQEGSPIYMQARTYLPAYGKFAQVDPAYDQTKDDPETWNLYNYVTNNPVTHTDPDGRFETKGPDAVSSTHTDVGGNVIAVYNDGDLDVYRHNNIKPGTYDGKHLENGGDGVEKMGVTPRWDEFAKTDKKGNIIEFNGDVVPAEGAKILFGQSFGPDVFPRAHQANGMFPNELIIESSNGGTLDIKVDKSVAPHGVYTGKMLFGKYVSARTAGNFLFGLNVSNRFFHSWKATWRVVGYYNAAGSNRNMLGAMAAGLNHYSSTIDYNWVKSNTYGESQYSWWAIVSGYNFGRDSTYFFKGW